MRYVRARKGLSPLIATVVLISATIVGGMLVYNYFQKSFSNVVAKSGALQLTATAEYLNSTHKLVHLDIFNAYSDSVTILNVKAIMPDGSVINAIIVNENAAEGQILIPSGEKYSLITIVPSNAVAVYVDYVIGNSNAVLQSTPVRIS